jgi:hypothetical protein
MAGESMTKHKSRKKEEAGHWKAKGLYFCRDSFRGTQPIVKSFLLDRQADFMLMGLNED